MSLVWDDFKRCSFAKVVPDIYELIFAQKFCKYCGGHMFRDFFGIAQLQCHFAKVVQDIYELIWQEIWGKNFAKMRNNPKP